MRPANTFSNIQLSNSRYVQCHWPDQEAGRVLRPSNPADSSGVSYNPPYVTDFTLFLSYSTLQGVARKKSGNSKNEICLYRM